MDSGTARASGDGTDQGVLRRDQKKVFQQKSRHDED